MDTQQWDFDDTSNTVIVSTVDIDWSLVDLSPGARVARGMLYVQRTYPDALSRVDINILNIGNGEHCVLGQLNDGYDCSPEFHEWGHDQKVAHGFLLIEEDYWDTEDDGWQLNTLWRNAFISWRDAA